MAISDAQYSRWLTDPLSKKTLLLELDSYSGDTLYLANGWYVSKPGDTDSNRPYIDVIQSIPPIISRYDRDSTIGRLSIINDGTFDSWIRDKITIGYPLNLFLGDSSWSREDFRTIFSGLCGGLFDSDNDRIDIRITDKRFKLNKKLVEVFWEDPITVLPLLYGSAFNVTPQYYGSTDLYILSNDSVAYMQPRDSGLNVSYTQSGSGFRLTSAPSGEITCDANANFSYLIGDVIGDILEKAGLSASEIDSNYINDYAISLYSVDPNYTALNALNELCNPISIKWRFNRNGVLKLTQLVQPENETAVYTIDEGVISLDSIKMVSKESHIGKIYVGYEKNWTVQNSSSLAGSVSDYNRSKFMAPFKTTSGSNSNKSKYPLAQDITVDTLIDTNSNAATYVTEQIVLRIERNIYRMIISGFLFQFEIGECINITATHYKFENGANAIIIGITEDLQKGITTIEVWL